MTAPDLEFRSTFPVVVVTAGQRRRAGLDFWPDGTMGFLRRDGEVVAVAPNGPHLAVHDLHRGGFTRGLRTASLPIEDPRSTLDHASGGPLLHDAASGLTLLVYHGESHPGGDAADYYSFLGMACSRDGGRSFTDLGRVLTSEVEEHQPGRPTPVDVGSGGFAVRDGFVWLFSGDRGIGVIRRHLSVARAPLAEVLAAADRGEAPRFQKWFDGRWDEPGLGGRSDDLLPHRRHPVLWFDVATIEPLGCFLVVFSTVAKLEDGVAHWVHCATWSVDGTTWSEPQDLYRDPVARELLYLTIDSGGPDQRRIEDDWFHLYRVSSSSPFRWDDAQLERVTVRYSARPMDTAVGTRLGGGGGS